MPPILLPRAACMPLILAGMLGAVSLLLPIFFAPAFGFEEIKDTGVSSDSLADTVAATNETSAIIDRLVSLSRDEMTHESLVKAFEPIQFMFSKVILPGHRDRLAEKKYGDSIAIYWYRVLFRSKDEGRFVTIYLKVTFTHLIDYWELTHFDFNTDVDEMRLP